MYRIPTKVSKLEYKEKVIKTEKEGDKVISTVVSLGWFALFEGSQEFLYIGMERPTDLEPGAEVDIIIHPRSSRKID